MKKIIALALCASLLLGLTPVAGCSPQKGKLSGTALAEALLSKERINHEHLSQSFDFLDDRLQETAAEPTAKKTRAKTVQAAARFQPNAQARSSKGEIISGSGDTAVYSWSEFEQLVTELHYFQSHFSAGQSRTVQVDGNISFLENHTDIKNKWVTNISYIDYLMQVEEGREIIYADDQPNENTSVGIRTVNDEINTTYEYYENQGDLYIRTLATPNRRYEYSTVSDEEVMAFVADNDNGYWRFTQLYSHDGESLSLNVLVMTDDLAYSFRYSLSENSIYSYSVRVISPDLQYEIAEINGSEITVFPGAFTGINELRVSQEEQTLLGEYGKWIGYIDDYGYYYTYAIPHIHTDEGVLEAPTYRPAAGGGITTDPTPLDENVGYANGSVDGLWEQVYPQLVFEVQGESVSEQFDNLHAALEKYGVRPVYDQSKIGKMATDVLKLTESYHEHYLWNGQSLATHESAMLAYETEKAKSEKYEALFAAAKQLPSITKGELLEIQQNAGFPSLAFATETPVSVTKGRISLSGLSASVADASVLEQGKDYVLKLALKKNTDELEELVVLDNLNQDTVSTYEGESLSLTLSGEFDLPTDVAEGEYDVVAYVATADSGIRVSKFQRVLCAGEVNDTVTLKTLSLFTTVTSEKVLRASYEKIFDGIISLPQSETPYRYEQVLEILENAVMDTGYFLSGATLELYDPATQTATSASQGVLPVGIYRLAYLGKAEGGKVAAYIYCEIQAG